MSLERLGRVFRRNLFVYFRESLQKYSVITMVVAAAAVAFGVFGVVRQSAAVATSSGIKAYFSSDDGQTWFTDDASWPFPFDHDGHTAYRVYMYQTSKGTQFVGYLERYTDEGLQALEPLLSESGNREQLRQAIQTVRQRYTEVKKPNDPRAKWLRVGSSGAANVEAVTSPDGADDSCILVFP